MNVYFTKRLCNFRVGDSDKSTVERLPLFLKETFEYIGSSQNMYLQIERHPEIRDE